MKSRCGYPTSSRKCAGDMARRSVLYYLKELRRPVATTRDLSAVSGRSPSATVQALNHLREEGLVVKIYRGIWAEAGNEKLSPYSVIPFLFSRQRAYVSFVSALHLHGIIEQIPQVITLASTLHTRVFHTAMGTYYVHRIHPLFFGGFGWYKGTGSFLIADPEKALVDCLYLSARKGKRFGHFPELHFPRSFHFNKTREWVERIPDFRIRVCVRKRLDTLLRRS